MDNAEQKARKLEEEKDLFILGLHRVPTELVRKGYSGQWGTIKENRRLAMLAVEKLKRAQVSIIKAAAVGRPAISAIAKWSKAQEQIIRHAGRDGFERLHGSPHYWNRVQGWLFMGIRQNLTALEKRKGSQEFWAGANQIRDWKWVAPEVIYSLFKRKPMDPKPRLIFRSKRK